MIEKKVKVESKCKVISGAGSFHDVHKTMKEFSTNDTSRYPKVVIILPNHECQ